MPCEEVFLYGTGAYIIYLAIIFFLHKIHWFLCRVCVDFMIKEHLTKNFNFQEVRDCFACVPSGFLGCVFLLSETSSASLQKTN